MLFVQIKMGKKLHLAYEPGEGRDPENLVPDGALSLPLCGEFAPQGYCMTANMPLDNAPPDTCRRCLTLWASRHKEAS